MRLVSSKPGSDEALLLINPWEWIATVGNRKTFRYKQLLDDGQKE
jgi:hypothetical protein